MPYANWTKPSTSNRTPPPRACIYPRVLPVPGTSVRSVRGCHNTRGTGSAFLYLPGTSVSSVRPCDNARNFWNFCKTFIPVPGTSVSYVSHSYRTRNFCDFCNTSIQVLETSGSFGRLLYPYQESTNPTQHNLVYLLSIFYLPERA